MSSQVDRSFLGRVTSPEMAEKVDYAEQHHDDDEDLVGLTGVVRGIRLASCRYTLIEGGGSSPEPGSGRLRQVATTSERPPSDAGEDRPGWIVDVELLPVG